MCRRRGDIVTGHKGTGQGYSYTVDIDSMTKNKRAKSIQAKSQTFNFEI